MKREFRVRIETDNDAFRDTEVGSPCDAEVSWILDTLANELQWRGLGEGESIRLRDSNGNTIGEAFYR
jgi:hypothetical protein